MAENSEALGFIPVSTVERQYVEHERYVLQHDRCGRRVGYLLHSEPMYGQPLFIAQHCIQEERRRQGYGEHVLDVVRDRGAQAGASCIRARVAVDLPALEFWLAEGFRLLDIVPGGRRRRRRIARLWLPLRLPLLTAETDGTWPSSAGAGDAAGSHAAIVETG